jgi:signal transduction histidine kinase
LDLLTNPVYSLLPLISFLVLVVLIILVLKAVRRSLSIQIFCGMLISSAVWSLLIFFMRSSQGTAQALTWEKLILGFYSLTFVFFYHFTIVYTKARGQNLLLAGVYLFLTGVIVLSQLNLVILDMKLDSGRYTLVMSPLSYALALINIGVMVAGSCNLLKKYKTSFSYDERNQLLYLSFAMLFPLIGALLDAFSNVHPTAIWGNLVFCLICSLAIIRYHLFNISLVLKKSFAHILLSTAITLPFISVMIAINHVVYNGSFAPWWVYVILVLLFSFFLRPFYSWLQGLIDRLFYRDRHDYLLALEKFNLESQNIDNVEKLGANICEMVQSILHCSQVYLFLPSFKDEGLVVRASDRPETKLPAALLGNQGTLVKWLKNHPEVLSISDLDLFPELQTVSNLERIWFTQMKAVLIAPIQGREEELAGVLVLGSKLSDQVYTSEDYKLLVNLTSHVGIKLENSRLYGDAVQMREGLNSMIDPVFIVSPAHKIQFINAAAKKIFGNVYGKNCWQALGREDKCPLCLKNELENRANISNQIIEMGDKLYEAVYGTFIDPQGSRFVIEVLRDITERRIIEKEKIDFERRSQLAARLATVGEMAAGIAHEINNPLTAVIGYAELLAVRKDLPEDVKQDLDNINLGAQRVANIVRRLMLFSRQSKPMRDIINVDDLIQTTLELSAYQLKSHSISVIKNIEKGVPQIVADGGQLQQVFLNLISNAESEMFSTHGKGILVITVETKGENLLISFRDNGEGISEENMRKLFQPFFTTKPVGKGTGLGLSICHGIVLEHNGRIWAESQPGKGAAFFVEIPVMQAEESEPERYETPE